MFKSHEAKKYFKNLFLASTKLILRLSIENLIGIRIRLELEIGSNPPPPKKNICKNIQLCLDVNPYHCTFLLPIGKISGLDHLTQAIL